MNLFDTLFYKKYVDGAPFLIPLNHWMFWNESLSAFPIIDTLQGISSVSRRTKKINLVILHHSGSLFWDYAIRWFNNPNTYSSTNFLIDRDGYVLCLVPEDRGALHMPNAVYNNSKLVNEMSIGVTLIGDGYQEFTQAQYEAVAMLCGVWMEKYGLIEDDIKKHCDIAHSGEQHFDPSPWNNQKFKNLLNIYLNI